MVESFYTDPDPALVRHVYQGGALACWQIDLLADHNTGGRVPIPRFKAITIDASASGEIAAMPHWAGESVDGVTRWQPAAEIVHELADGAEQLLRRRS